MNKTEKSFSLIGCAKYDKFFTQLLISSIGNGDFINDIIDRTATAVTATMKN